MSSIGITVSRAEQERLRFIRWVLLLVNAAEASGVGSLQRRQFHSLLFVSFASSRFYGIEPLRQRAQRTEQGPYYRAAHIALGVLTLSGLVDLKDFRPHPSPKDVQFEGTFSATPKGLAVGRRLAETYQGELLYQFLLDLCLGTVSGVLEDKSPADSKASVSLDQVFEEDLTYRQAVARPGNQLFVEESPEDQQTPTLNGLKSIDAFLKQRTHINRKDVLSAYQTLLLRRVA